MVSIAKAEWLRSVRLSESRNRAADTRKFRSKAAAAAGAAEGGGRADIICHMIVHIILMISYV
jgi:hypothetical protein